jgi:hypothetical protein
MKKRQGKRGGGWSPILCTCGGHMQSSTTPGRMARYVCKACGRVDKRPRRTAVQVLSPADVGGGIK